MARKTINLDDFKGIKIDIDITDIIEDNTKEAAETLQSINNWKFQRRSKSYSKGWTTSIEKRNQKDVKGTVYNKTDWQLTWLLENGHLIVNKKGGVGWAAPHKHIEPTYDKQAEKFIKDMQNVDIEVEFE